MAKQVIDLLAHHRVRQNSFPQNWHADCSDKSNRRRWLNRMARTFQSSDGDIRAVLKAMIWSPEFWSRGIVPQRFKTPSELVISAVRALGTDVDTPMPLVQWVGRIGEPLYQCQPPTGYADKADACGKYRSVVEPA